LNDNGAEADLIIKSSSIFNIQSTNVSFNLCSFKCSLRSSFPIFCLHTPHFMWITITQKEDRYNFKISSIIDYYLAKFNLAFKN